MTSKISQSFFLQHLIAQLLPAHRDLILEILDPANLAERIPITGGRAIDLAHESELVFCKTESESLVTAVLHSKSQFVIARPQIRPYLPVNFGDRHVLILTDKPRLLMALLLTPFDAASAVSQQKETIHPAARLAPDIILGRGVVIGADVEIGASCIIGPNTVIDHATIGKNTRIGFNCSIGYDGFGYEIDTETGETVKFPHFGRVQIGCNVEIFSNCCIARGSLRDTILEDNVRVDNLVHIAHNCHIKRGALLIANAMIGGSTTVGEYAWVAPSSSLMNGIQMGRCAMTGLGAAAVKSIEDNAIVVGIPAKKLRNRFPEDFHLLRE